MVGAPNPGSFWACSGPDIRCEDTGDGEQPNDTNPYRLVLSPVHIPVLCGRRFLLTGKDGDPNEHRSRWRRSVVLTSGAIHFFDIVDRSSS